MELEDIVQACKNEGKRPSPTVRRALAAAIEEDALAFWTAYSGTAGGWQNVDGAVSPLSEVTVAAIWAPLAGNMKSLLKELEKRTLGFLVRNDAHASTVPLILRLAVGVKKL